VSDYDFDLFVIGAGSGGVRASRMAAAFGAKVAVAEERFLGGTCVNVGCVPKKLFVYASHILEECQDASGFGWSLGQKQFNWQTLLENKDKEIARLNRIYENLLKTSGVELFSGRATIADAHTLIVNEQRITADKILIATGGRPYVPDFEGNDLVLTSEDIFYLDQLPERVVVVGGGYIAVEFAGIFNGLGVDTCLLYRGAQILRHFDHEIRDFAADEFRKKGINIRCNTTIEKIERSADQLICTLSNGELLETDAVLYATGRKPYTGGLGLNNTAVRCRENGTIITNQHFQTDEESIFALGDVTGGMELTPVALAEAMVFANTEFNNSPQLMDYSNIATAVFSQPAIAVVGLTEDEARENFTDVLIYKSSFRHLKHSLTTNQEKTFMKLVVDKVSDKVLGAHMVGSDAGEIIQGLAVAIKAGVSKAVLDATIGIHPTAAEEFVTMRTPAE
jgi:glutathione reductase (NADPH)